MTGFRNALLGAAGAAGGGYSVDNSIVLDDGSSQYLSRTPVSVGNRNTWTFSCWLKLGDTVGSANTEILYAGASGNFTKIYLSVPSAGDYRLEIVQQTSSSYNFDIRSNLDMRDPHAWYHLVVMYDSTAASSSRLLAYLNNEAVTFSEVLSRGTEPSSGLNSFVNNTGVHYIGRDGATYTSAYFSQVCLVDGSALNATSFGEYDTNGVWRPIDVSGLTFGTNGFYLPFSAGSGANLGASSVSASTFTPAAANYTYNATYLTIGSGTINNNGSPGVSGRLNNPFNGDFTFSFTATAIAGSIFGVFDATELSSFSTGTDDGGLDSMTNSWWYDDGGNGTGGGGTVGNGYFMYGNSSQGTGPIAAGSAVTIERTGSTIKITDDSSDAHSFSQTFSGPVYIMVGHRNITSKSMDYDSVSMNGIEAFAVTGSPTQSSDTPTNVFATLTPLNMHSGTTLSKGNTQFEGDAGWCRASGSIAVTSGKWYFEFHQDDANYLNTGWGTLNVSKDGSAAEAELWVLTEDGITWDETTTTAKGYNHTVGSIRNMAVDMDNGKIWFGENGTYWGSGNPSTDTNPTLTFTPSNFGPMTLWNQNGLSEGNRVNFGDSPTDGGGNADGNGYGDFDNAVPSSFLALCTANLYTNAAPAIEDGTAHFQATTYTGTGSAREVDQSGNTVFQPDFVWIKNRVNAGGYRHELFDAVRGVQKYLQSSAADAEGTDSTTLTSFDSDGYSYGSGIWGNSSGEATIAWQWKGDGTSGSTNENGSITSTVNANDTAGFSICTYTGTGSNGTFGHGLSAAPEFVIVKKRSGTANWQCYHIGLANQGTGYIVLSTTAAEGTLATYWNSTIPNSSVVSLGTHVDLNESSATYVSYCFRSIPGYSAFGSYVGNGSSDGPVIMLDFTPAYLLVKNINSGSVSDHWYVQSLGLYDYNGDTGHLFADATDVEQASRYFDYLSNGFKVVTVSATANGSNETHIYAAFAENPFAGSSPATAR